jgi:predicted dehydrogenase
MINIGICGFGYWGPTVYRTLVSNADFEVAAIADLRQSCRIRANRLNPTLQLFEDGREMINRAAIDAIAIATPVGTHFGLASYALRKGKHVLVEKPMCASVPEAEELVAIADKQNRTLLVDHVYVFHEAVRKIKNLKTSGAIGQISYYDVLRVNLGLFQPDVNVLWDLAPHDFSIMDYIFEEAPHYIEATGYCHVNSKLPDIVYVTAHYRSQMIAHLNLSWMSPVKVRRTAVGGSKQMIVWDDLNFEERLKIYDSGIEFRTEAERNSLMPSYRIGEISSPRLPNTEPLAAVFAHFGRVIRDKLPSPIDGRAGLRIVRLLEQTQLALNVSLDQFGEHGTARKPVLAAVL